MNPEEEMNPALHTPKRMKLETTAQYIYKTLYEEGKHSDLTVEALSHKFHLHRVFLCQSPYFASMFGGAWSEYKEKHVVINIVDPQITIDALKIVFGSLYNDEITLTLSGIVPILACATMFLLDGVIDKCREVMTETINPKSAVMYYNVACQYSIKTLEEACVQWFLVNLMTHSDCKPLCYLRTIQIPLMTMIVTNPNLFVFGTEICLYVVLKRWMYMHLHPDLTDEPLEMEMSTFYSSRTDEIPFLLTEDGKDFISVFHGLRIDNLISRHSDFEDLQRGNIIPSSWLNLAVLKRWKMMLKVNPNIDDGPSSELVNELFLSNSVRCAVLVVRSRSECPLCLRLSSGFNYGMNLLVVVANRTSLSIKREYSPFSHLLSIQTARRFAIRVTVSTVNEQGHISFQQTTGIKSVSLSKNEGLHLMKFDRIITFPLIISANILFTSLEDVVREDAVTQPTH